MRKSENNHKETFNITFKTKGSVILSTIPFKAIKKTVLGSRFFLSLVFVGKKKTIYLNKKYRGKRGLTDILTFPLGNNAAEIFINQETAKKKSARFGRSYKNYVIFIFIHGLTHLKGYRHGSRMEAAERRIRKRFGV